MQAGIDAADDGDTVLVAPGEYVITEPITFRGKAITVVSEAGSDETTIRMGAPADPKRASVVIFENNETATSILDGFTITGGKGSILDDSPWGGGILFNASSGTVGNCAIVQNEAHNGGGVFCAYPCSPILIDCIIAENRTEIGFGGGGMFAFSGSSPSVSNCIIRENSAMGSQYGSGCGGGVLCYRNSSLTMTDCTIVQNSAGNTGGGVVYGENSSVTLTQCAIANNRGTRWCGGVAGYLESTATISNCTICGNSGGTSGGGIGCYDGASATVTNSILWANTAATGNEIHLEQAPTEFSITYSNVAGGQAGVDFQGGRLNWGEGNIDADPYFADPANGDYHLRSEAGRWDTNSQAWIQDEVTSPCIDAGDPVSDWTARLWPHGIRTNMGAYGGTLQASRSLSDAGNIADVNRDGIVDSVDMCMMIDHWGTDEPYCDIAPAPFGDRIVDVQDLVVLAENLFEDYRVDLVPMRAHWKLDETSGDSAFDSIHKNNGTLHGNPIWQSDGGKVGGSLQLDGIDDYVSTPFILNPAKGSFSVSAWIKGGAPGQVMISQKDHTDDRNTNPGDTWLLADASYGRLMTRLMHPPFPPLVSESVITDDKWHHVGLVYDVIALCRYLYVDGAEVAKDSDFVGGVGSDGGLHIGADKTLDAGSFFFGLIDDVRIYNVALTAGQIEALAQ
ncbi:MAG: right-handed parallel beta-helix repeat-containing protein [Candidatus Zixiibacteriota bacterium]|nr:MAG: right-handed parallel beta-helix repeat-containing protein [candidate division Zixibacteria bacterium]